MTKYVGAVHELLMRIAEKLAEGLGVKSENIGFENWMFQFRMNKYHFTSESVGLTGIETHTDSGFIYIVQIDEDVCGLEVMDKSGHFIPVDPHPGAIIVNLGDIAKVVFKPPSIYNIYVLRYLHMVLTFFSWFQSS